MKITTFNLIITPLPLIHSFLKQFKQVIRLHLSPFIPFRALELVVWLPTVASCFASESNTPKRFINFEEPNTQFDVTVEPEGNVRRRVGQDWA